MTNLCHTIWLVAALAVALPGCMPQSQNVWLLKQWNVKCKEAADLLAGVKDVPSAKAAQPRLAKLLGEMDQIQARLEKTYDSSDVEPSEERGARDQGTESIVQMQRLLAETMRIGKQPELTAALGEAWNRLPSKHVLDATGMDLEAQ